MNDELLNPKATIEVLRYTVFWRKLFLNDGAFQPKSHDRGIKVYRFLAEIVFE